MGYKRAEWRSGLRYKQTCDMCKTTVIYMDNSLGFRPWFPDGFVYCPTCQKPLRHNEIYAIDKPQPKTIDLSHLNNPYTHPFGFCNFCGNPFLEESNFCPHCGARKIN